MSMKKIDVKKSIRANAYEHLSGMVMPCLTVIKQLDITNVVRQSQKGHKFNLIMNYLIAKSAMNIPEFHLWVDAKTLDLYQDDNLLIDMVVLRKDGENAYCNLRYDENFEQFEKNYLKATKYCWENNKDLILKGVRIGTSNVKWTDLVGTVNGYSPRFTNPFVMMSRYTKKFFKYYMNISFQFHHLQMDGKHACLFLEKLQKEIKKFKINKRNKKYFFDKYKI